MNNPYSAPAPGIIESPVESDPSLDSFYVVSKKKFFVLFLITLGAYSIYWGFKNWSQLKKTQGVNCWPIPRGIFLLFFIHSLMKYVAAKASAINYVPKFDLNGHATVVVVALIINHVLDRLSGKNIGFPIVDIVSIAFLIPLVLLFWRMQGVINAVSGDSEGMRNSKFTTANIIWIILGAILWLLVFVGLYQGLTGVEAN